MSNPWASSRLVYRAVERPSDEALFVKLAQDGIAYSNSETSLHRPQSLKETQEHMDEMDADSLLFVTMCLPASSGDSRPVPIGYLLLSKNRKGETQHRNGWIGIDIGKEYQGKGYGSEAIEWLLDWGFQTAGLHRVGIAVFSYNEGARRLYERLGFKLEGTIREMYWHDGQWYDDIYMSMIDREWREKSKARGPRTEK